MPVDEATLTVLATSANYTFSKTFKKTIDLKANTITTFGVSGLTKTAKTDYSGTYVLTDFKVIDGETTVTKMANAWVSGGNNLIAVNATLEGGFIYYDPDAVDLTKAQITLSRITESTSEYYNMYTMKQNSLYLYAATSDKNQLKGQETVDENAYWEVSNNGSDGWSIVATKSSNRNILRYNSTSYVFSCYASGQDPFALYSSDKLKPTPVISVEDITIGPEAKTTQNTNASFNSNTSTVTAAAFDDTELTTTSTWITTSVSGKVVYYTVTANSSSSDRIGYIKITASNSDGRSVWTVVKVTQAAAGSTPTQYKYTINTSDFSSTGYGKPINDITATEVGGTKTLIVKHTSVNAGLQSSKIQFKKSVGVIYNTTDLGKVISVVLNGASGSYTVYTGTTANPTTSINGGFFAIAETSGATLTGTSITVTFEK